MSRKTITYDIKLVDSIYRRNNDAMLRLAKRNLENNKLDLDNYIKKIFITKGKEIDKDLFSELSNIDWIFLNSIFLALFSNFENLIYKLTRIVEHKHPTKIEIEDIKGHGYVDRYRKYMHLVADIKSAESDELWSELNIYKLVRNKIAHEGGYLNRNPKTKFENRKEFRYLIDNKVLLAGTFGHIRIRETHFLEKFCDLTNQILNKLFTEIERMK